MKIGFPTHPRKDLAKEIGWIGKNGFDFVDLFLEEENTYEKVNVESALKMIRKYNLHVVGHTSPFLQFGLQIKAIREASTNEVCCYFPVFAKFGVKYVTVHANWPRGSLFSDKEAVKWQIDAFKKIVEEAKKYGIKIMLEPVESEFDTIENIDKILKGVPEMFFHLDIGHANVHGRTPVKFIEKFHKKLVHVHVHDNNGKKDEHLPIGQGTINWENVIKTLKKYYDSTITLEVYTNKEDALESKEKLRKMWDKM